jgi:lysozyme
MWFLRLFGVRPAEAKPITPVQATGVAGAWLGLALSLTAAWEGMYTHVYRDSVGVPTVCYGMTAADHRPMKNYTEDECKRFLLADLPKYDAQAKRCIPAIDSFPPHRHAAIVSFTYNVGGGALCKSSVARGLNAGDLHGTVQSPRGCDALMLYDKGTINGKRVAIKGLHNRRVQERQWCLMEN